MRHPNVNLAVVLLETRTKLSERMPKSLCDDQFGRASFPRRSSPVLFAGHIRVRVRNAQISKSGTDSNRGIFRFLWARGCLSDVVVRDAPPRAA